VESGFTETSGGIARKSGACQAVVQGYARAGLIESIVLDNGLRLFKPEAADQVREIKRRNIANRSHKGKRR
jgi:hypothetical protein